MMMIYHLARIINEPKRNIGATSFERMARYAIDQDRSILDALNEVDFMGYTCKSSKFCRCNSVDLFKDLQKCKSIYL